MNKQIDIEELLDWYILAGVTETCGDLPCLNSQPLVLNDNKKLLQQSAKIQKAPVSLSENISKNAKDICSKASSLDELKEILIKFEGCNLKNTAASTILGDGCVNAKIMLIGEAPGADEDRIGKPFVGRCGKLLDKMLEAISINRDDCYITNVLPWRPPGNRTPTDDELAVCLPFLKRQIELIKPQYILLLGGISLKSVIDTDDSISRARGKWFEYNINENQKAFVLATYHPSYLLRSTAQKSKVWADLLRLKKKISENA